MFEPLHGHKDDKPCILWPTTKRIIANACTASVYGILCTLSDLFRIALFATTLLHIKDAILIIYILIFTMIALLIGCLHVCCIKNHVDIRSGLVGTFALLNLILAMLLPSLSIYLHIHNDIEAAAYNRLAREILLYALNVSDRKEKCRRIIACNFYFVYLFQDSRKMIGIESVKHAETADQELMEAVVTLHHEAMNSRNCLTNLDTFKSVHCDSILRLHVFDALFVGYCVLFTLQCILSGFVFTQNEIIWIFCGLYLLLEIVCYCYHIAYIKVWLYVSCLLNVPVVTGGLQRMKWAQCLNSDLSFTPTTPHEVCSTHMHNIDNVYQLIFDQIDCMQVVLQEMTDLDDNLVLIISQYCYTALPVLKGKIDDSVLFARYCRTVRQS